MKPKAQRRSSIHHKVSPIVSLSGRIMNLTRSLVAPVLATGLAAGIAGTSQLHAGPAEAPLVIGHRGASGYRPEHTLASYELAIALGADFIEPDLVSTRDGVLVARHENEIGGTTDVASRPEFASRRMTKVIDGVSLTGWFTEDFTLAELKTLRAIERIPAVRQRNTLYNGIFDVPTFQEVIDLARQMSRGGRTVGIYPETKHPTYFQSIGLPLEEPLAAALQRNGLNSKNAAVFVQSFEVANLHKLQKLTHARLIQLFGARTARPFDFVVSGDLRTYADLASPAGLAGISAYAYGIGPSKDYIIPRDASGASLAPTELVANAHGAGLRVHPYTFRNENQFLPAELRVGTDPNAYGRAIDEYLMFYAAGVDGLFSDNSDTAILARDLFLAQ
jgi:glycerophosphoryl diester phosphodiesterase